MAAVYVQQNLPLTEIETSPPGSETRYRSSKTIMR